MTINRRNLMIRKGAEKYRFDKLNKQNLYSLLAKNEKYRGIKDYDVVKFLYLHYEIVDDKVTKFYTLTAKHFYLNGGIYSEGGYRLSFAKGEEAEFYLLITDGGGSGL